MRDKRKVAMQLLQTVGTILIALLIGFIITAIVSEEPVKAYRALLLGPLTRINRFGNWIEESITLTLTGLAICTVFRAKQFSLGAEGQVYLGALAAGLVALFVPLTRVPILHIALALVAAGTAGFLWGLIPGMLKAYLNANELVSSLMLNTIALKLYDLLLDDYLRPPTSGWERSEYFPTSAVLPRIIPNTRITGAVFLAIAAVVIVYIWMYRTPFGYSLRMTGANQSFARYGGINTKRVIVLAVAGSGILAGLAGAYLALGIQGALVANISLGMGFEGVVVSLLARNNPLAVPFGALFYSYLRTGADLMESTTDVTRELVSVIQAVIVLSVTAEGMFNFIRKRMVQRRTGSDAT